MNLRDIRDITFKYFKELFNKFYEATGTFGGILLLILFFYVLSLYDNCPLERFIKLSPDNRDKRVEALKNVDNIINQCKRLNMRYTRENEFQDWYEDIDSFGAWYEPRRSIPVVKVDFKNKNDSDYSSYCEVNLIFLDYKFYHLETIEMGEDQYGQTHYQSFKNHMCDDWSDERGRRCTRR